jgi:DNA polymerase-1
MKIAILDGYNLLHRARFGMRQGDHHIVYSFFRSLRPLIDDIKPDLTYVVLEGVPRRRMMLDADYKANRKIEPDDPRAAEMAEFRRQKAIVLSLLEKLPITMILHPDHECDDVIAHLVADKHAADEKVVVSSDTDFIQLFGMNNKVSVYNPVQKKFLVAPDYNYVVWKALRGDKSDNIPGMPGIGDVTAEKLTRDSDALALWIKENPHLNEAFSRNLDLVGFEKVQDPDNLRVTVGSPDWEGLYESFRELGFWSIINQKSWSKYVKTFNP